MKAGNLRWLWLTIVILLLDQMTKLSIREHFYVGEFHPVLPFLNLTLAYNKGASFGFLNQASGWQLWLFSIIAIVISMIVFIWLARTPRNKHWSACALALILGGALGNLFDRLYHGFVTDFIDFHIGQWHYATFNIADSAIVIGVIMLLVETVLKKNKVNES